MQIPFFREMESAETVLLAGAGGGFDVFATVPLLLWLRGLGKTVHLASFSFSKLVKCDAEHPHHGIWKVTAASKGPAEYFPELALCEWLALEGMPTPIYAFQRYGVKGLGGVYRWLVDKLQPDTVILVDGGTDILMRGDEPSLGTPEEDISSLLAVDSLTNIKRKLVLCLGFGVDTHHGVSHGLVLENIAGLIEEGGYLGAWSLTQDMEEGRLYQAAVEYGASRFPHMPSIVNKSVATSMEGWFGNRHFTDRTEGSTLFLNPLMPLFWAFRLDTLAGRLLYRDCVLKTDSHLEMTLAIDRFRDQLPQLREWVDIPH